jgi:Na+/glutamate symporter
VGDLGSFGSGNGSLVLACLFFHEISLASSINQVTSFGTCGHIHLVTCDFFVCCEFFLGLEFETIIAVDLGIWRLEWL